MNANLIWEDPPVRANHKAIAAALRLSPGKWARIGRPYGRGAARTMASRIGLGQFTAYEPAGDFEAARRTIDGEHYVYVRYLGDGVTDE